MLIVIGTGLTLVSFIGFSHMTGNINVYYFLWFRLHFRLHSFGPIPHQIIVSHWFRRNRGRRWESSMWASGWLAR